jgi:hypothetical protein
MGKDEMQIYKEKSDHIEKKQQEYILKRLEELKMYEDGQASAYLVSVDDQNGMNAEKK